MSTDGRGPRPDLPDYSIRESKRAKRVRIDVTPAGRVEVVVPAGFPHDRVPKLLTERRGWLEEALARVRRPEAASGQRNDRLPYRVDLPALGRQWPVVYSGRGRGGTREDGEGQLRVHGPDPATARNGLCRWLGRIARAELVPWAYGLAEERGLTLDGTSIRAQATRWGSCSTRGRLNLNRNLLFLEPAIVRYLLLHELAHRVHLDHSPAFWSLVARWEPGYARLDRELRESGGRQVPLWALPDRLLPSDFFPY